jgi:hypothetical protein
LKRQAKGKQITVGTAWSGVVDDFKEADAEIADDGGGDFRGTFGRFWLSLLFS